MSRLSRPPDKTRLARVHHAYRVSGPNGDTVGFVWRRGSQWFGTTSNDVIPTEGVARREDVVKALVNDTAPTP